MLVIRCEGWRFLPHSYAIVNQWQCLELLRRDSVHLAFRDIPFFMPRWRRVRNLMPEKWEEAIAGLKDSEPGAGVDCVVRVFVPVSFRKARARRTLVLGTADFGWLPAEMIENQRSLADAHRESDAVIVSPSAWSKWGLLRAGADPDRVEIVPHGVETRVFRPLAAEERRSHRRRLGYGDRFVFLNVSAHTLSKGTDLILKAFARVAAKRDDVFLVLKGSDAVYDSRAFVDRWIDERLDANERRTIADKMHYVGASLPVGALAAVYGAADCYLTPYRSESFNLPALEAAACGLPVICTAGGPTDDFTTAEFARRISAKLVAGIRSNELLREPNLDELVEVMLAMVDDRRFSERARIAGPDHVGARFTWRHAVDRLLEVATGQTRAGAGTS